MVLNLENENDKIDNVVTAKISVENEIKMAPSMIDISKYSDIGKLLRIVSYVNRFVNNLKAKSKIDNKERVDGDLKAE